MSYLKSKEKIIWILIALGFIVATVSALEGHWAWLSALCGRFGSGCRETRNFSFIGFPIAYWGVLFYLVAGVVNRFAKGLMFWIVMAAMGAEITFLWIMYTLEMPCIFCLFNGLVMLVLFLFFLNRQKLWQTIAVCSISFIAFNYLLMAENKEVVQAAGIKTGAGSPQNAGNKTSGADQIFDFDLEGNPTLGPEDAAVTVVEFSDYMCPACRRLHPVTAKLRQLYKDKVRWVFKDFPLRQHQGADRLAEAARCAWDQNKFWEFQDEMFSGEQPVDPMMLPAIADALGLDVSQFAECVQSRKYMFEVINDRQDALNAGIDSTPSVFANGRKMTNALLEDELKEIVDKELEKKGAKR